MNASACWPWSRRRSRKDCAAACSSSPHARSAVLRCLSRAGTVTKPEKRKKAWPGRGHSRAPRACRSRVPCAPWLESLPYCVVARRSRPACGRTRPGHGFKRTHRFADKRNGSSEVVRSSSGARKSASTSTRRPLRDPVGRVQTSHRLAGATSAHRPPVGEAAATATPEPSGCSGRSLERKASGRVKAGAYTLGDEPRCKRA